jgi:hypothetical protein
MSRTHVTVLLALLVLAGPTSTAFAQVFGPGRMPAAQAISNPGRATASDVDTCNGTPGGSRVRPNCDPAMTAKMLQEAAKIQIPDPAQQRTSKCQASTVTEYIQQSAVARVNGSVSVKSCPAGSSGTYDLVLRVKDENGEIKPLAFNEKWQRSDTADVKFGADYPIGERVELLDVSIDNFHCSCADPPKEPTQTSTPSGD